MNKLGPRFEIIISELVPCKTFADVGCDHGYVANEMLSRGKCEHSYITDVSALCLDKAIALLSKNHEGRFTPIVTDGLKGVPAVDQVLIAGMGGELICSIIQNADYLPKRLVLQPMKNPEKVREVAIKLGYKLIKDYTFKDIKFYNLIVCERGEDSYTKDELTFGRDNLRLKGEAFKEQISKKITKLKSALDGMNEDDKSNVEEQIKKLTEIIE